MLAGRLKSFADVDKVTKLIPATLNIKLKDAIEQEPAINDLARKDPRIAEVLEVAQDRRYGAQLRHARRRSGHFARAAQDLVPLYKTNKDEIVTEYDMVGLEKLALLKMDFLGLTTLDIIQDALALIEKHEGVKIEVDSLPLDDKQDLRDLLQGFHQRRLPV